MEPPPCGAVGEPQIDCASGQLTLTHKVLYGLGHLGVALTTGVALAWLLPRYRPDPTDLRWTVLAPAGAFAVAMIVGHGVDALANPLVGFWSDRVRTRWGRRKPFILIGAPFLAITFVLVWAPPVAASSALNAVYLAITASCFFFAFIVVVCPYLAMLPEITSDPGQRVSLAVWQGVSNLIGGVGGMLASGYLIDRHGYVVMALCMAPIVLLCSWAPLLVPMAAESAPISGRSLRGAVTGALRDRFFLPYVIGQLLFWMGVRVILGALPKIVGARAGVAETQQGLVMAVGLLVAALFFPLIPVLSRRVGNKHVLVGAMVLFGIAMIPLAALGRLPVPWSVLGQAGAIMVLVGPSIAVLFTIPNALLSDIAARDAQEAGEGREAIYFGVQGLIVRAGQGLGVGLAAVELAHFGETAAQSGGFVACPLTAMAFAWLGALVTMRYPGR